MITLDDFDVTGVHYFFSGANRVGWISGLARAGFSCGVAAPEVVGADGLCRRNLLAALKQHDRVFADSGAFSEMDFSTGRPVLAKPMSNKDWDNVFGVYWSLVRYLPGSITVVAPDRVGDQRVTMERLRARKGDLELLHRLGAQVLFPVQRGDTPAVHFYREACEEVGFRMTPAIPMMKDATSDEDAAAFIRDEQPDLVHLLGRGPRSRGFKKMLGMLRAEQPELEVQCDSVGLVALSGWRNGPCGGPRALTLAKERAKHLWPGLPAAEIEARAVACLSSRPPLPRCTRGTGDESRSSRPTTRTSNLRPLRAQLVACRSRRKRERLSRPTLAVRCGMRARCEVTRVPTSARLHGRAVANRVNAELPRLAVLRHHQVPRWIRLGVDRHLHPVDGAGPIDAGPARPAHTRDRR